MLNKIPLVGKPKYSIHDLLRLSMSVNLAEGGEPTDTSGVGSLIGRLITSGAYRAVPVLYRESGVVGKSWELQRVAKDAQALASCLPEMKLPTGHVEGMTLIDNVQWIRDDWMCEVVSGLIDAAGRKAYSFEQEDGRVRTIIKDVFLMEHIAEWEWLNLMDHGHEPWTMAHYTDSRGGRNYPGSVVRDGDKLVPMISTQSGDASYLLRRAVPTPVSQICLKELWLEKLKSETGLDGDTIHQIGTDLQFAIAFGSNPKAYGARGLRTIGDQKRNLLEFIHSCHHLAEGMKTGYTHGWLSKDAHASGLVCTSIAVGSSCALQIGEGKKVYDSLASLIKIPNISWIPAKIRAYLQSSDWGKAAAIPIQYTSRNLAWTFITGPNSGEEMEDEEGNPLFSYELDGAQIPRDSLNPKIAEDLALLSDEQIKDLAEVVNNATLAAFHRYDPKLYQVTDAVLSSAKLMYGDKGTDIPRLKYDNFDCVHFAVKTALDWFPADDLGRRKLPQVSITVPRKYRAQLESLGVPTRFQPRSAPFTRGEVDERRRPILPWTDTGTINRIDTPSGLLVRGTSICDSRIMLNTIKELNKYTEWKNTSGFAVGHRHDSIWVVPSDEFYWLSRVYMGQAVDESATHYREYIAQIVGNRLLANSPPHGENVILPHSNVMFR
jgi:hypothetical protein